MTFYLVVFFTITIITLAIKWLGRTATPSNNRPDVYSKH